LEGKPVITATQMLESMQWEPRPTRAEASDVANAIFDGTDAIMLSGETAAGDFPVEAVGMMNQIALKTETAIDHEEVFENRAKSLSMTIAEALSQSVAFTAASLDVTALITPTQSGYSARMISKYRPKAPIVAVTFSESVARRLTLVSGVEPVSCTGTTNLMKVHVIGNVIAKGQGLGRHYAFGKTVVTNDPEEANTRMENGDILVTFATDKDMMPAIEKAGGIITDEGGLTSHAAVVGLNMGIPVIVGVNDVVKVIKDGVKVTVDGSTGNVHQGHASVL